MMNCVAIDTGGGGSAGSAGQEPEPTPDGGKTKISGIYATVGTLTGTDCSSASLPHPESYEANVELGLSGTNFYYNGYLTTISSAGAFEVKAENYYFPQFDQTSQQTSPRTIGELLDRIPLPAPNGGAYPACPILRKDTVTGIAKGDDKVSGVLLFEYITVSDPSCYVVPDLIPASGKCFASYKYTGKKEE